MVHKTLTRATDSEAETARPFETGADIAEISRQPDSTGSPADVLRRTAISTWGSMACFNPRNVYGPAEEYSQRNANEVTQCLVELSSG